MASLVDAVPQQVNGLADPSSQSPPSPQPQSQQPQSDSSQSAANAPAIKRKRETSDDGSADLDDGDANHEAKPVANGDNPVRDEATLIRNYFEVIQRYATASTISSLNHALPMPAR